MTKLDPIQPRQRIIFRADGNSRIGLGHVTRSLALAHMLRDEFECIFAIQAPDKAVKDQILSTCHGIIVLPACLASEERFQHELEAYISEEEIVVLDGYTFGTPYQQNIKNRGAVLVCIDDIYQYPFVADVVINQAGGVDASQYRTAPFTKLYLGPAYALLRAPFLEGFEKTEQEDSFPLHIFLCMGGADPDNHTLRIAQELQQLNPEAILEIVVGSAYKHQVNLNTWLQKSLQHQIHTNLSAEAMRDLMSGCKAAITSASGVAYEYAAVGGALFIVQTADNQTALYQYLLKSGMAKAYAAMAEVLDEGSLSTTIKELQQKQRQIFDGQSPARLREIFSNLSLQRKLKVRLATADDLMLLFEWANDPEVRSHSFNTASIPLEIHTSWFNTKLDSPDSKLYIADIQHKPAAHIRFEIKDHTATISYLISSDYRGKGLGHTILLKGIDQLKRDNIEVTQVEGLVQKNNIASVRAFEKAGFRQATPDGQYPDAYKFTLGVH